MSLIDAAKDVLAPRGERVPVHIAERISRVDKSLNQDGRKYKRRLCELFLEGDVYSYLDTSNLLNRSATAPGPNGKPSHRLRNRYNFIRPMVDAKVSSSTTRAPGYEIYPTTTDPEDLSGARLAEKLARQGYEQWGVKTARVVAAETAIGRGGRAYALPYFDPNVGPFRQVLQDDGTVRWQGEGEIKVMVLNGNQVGWQDGASFVNSRYYVVRQARAISDVRAMEGFFGGKLTADASTHDVPQDKPQADMVMVTMYFERPSEKHPKGRYLTIANDQQIVPESHYPMVHKGEVLDEPVLHELVYRASPDTTDDLGLTWELIDFQRTLQDIYNKIMEIKNRGLMLRMMAPVGALSGQKAPDDVPGGITYYNPVAGMKPEWEQGPNPNLIGQLLTTFDRVFNDMKFVASDNDVTAAPNVASGSIQAEVQASANRWSQFISNFARFDSETMRHCLMLAQEFYSEERLLKVQGRFGWEPVATFRGADIMGQIDVTVNPASIESHTPAAVLQKLAWIQANFPGYVRPEIAIEIALNGSSPDSVIESFEFDKARINGIIQRLRDGTIMEMQPRMELDPLSGQPIEMPGWMPRPFDNLDVQMWVFENWLKTPDFERQPPELHEVAMVIYSGMKQLQAQQAAEAAAAQLAQAEGLGMDNAAKPQSEKPMPSTPSPTADPGAPQ